MMNSALVTGGAGFIGGHLVRRLHAIGLRVTVLDDLSSGKPENVPSDVRLVQGSVEDALLVGQLIKEVDCCYHLAAISSVPVCYQEPSRSHRINSSALVTLLAELKARASSIPMVFASSAAVYGDSGGTLSEGSPTKPMSQYAADKLSCEFFALAANHSYGIASTGLRFFNVFGPGQDANSPYSGVITRFMSAASLGEEITIYGDGEQTRDFVWVGDVVEALLLAANREQRGMEVFNVCSGVETSIKALAELVQGRGSARPIVYQAPRAADVARSVGDATRAAQRLRFKAQVHLADGLSMMKGATRQ